MIDLTYLATLTLLACASALVLAAMLYPAALLRWFQRKRYQYEVTFSLYMLTSTEKFIFNSVLFLLLSLLIIAASLYLPDHLTIIANRLFYYFSGNEETLATGAQKAGQLLESSRALTTTQGLSAAAAAGRGVMEL
ncbi:hypothetical protein HBI26_078360 [Parastagonospora nodorum]|nr:hypothetical protein HBI26_078360 [Parastagonospora nodorum]